MHLNFNSLTISALPCKRKIYRADSRPKINYNHSTVKKKKKRKITQINNIEHFL